MVKGVCERGRRRKMAWVKQQSRGKRISCFNCNQEGHFVKDCPKPRPGSTPEKKRVVCFLCNQEGHFKQDCPSKFAAQQASDQRLCFICNQPGHFKQDCPRKYGRPAQDQSDKICFQCNKTGHLVKDCPEKEVVRAERFQQLCFLCNEPGHLKQDCPIKKESQGPKIQCYHCNQFGHVKRDCPELPSNYRSSPVRETGSRSRGSEHNKGTMSAEEHWPVLSKEPEVKNKFSQPSSSSASGPAVSSPSEKVQVTRSANVEGNDQASRNTGYDRRDTREVRTPFPPFIDTHCHLEYVFERYNHTLSFSDFMKDWRYPSNFDGCIASFCDPAAFSSFGMWSDLLAESTEKVWAAFGIHPHNAKYYHSSQGLEEKLKKCLEHSRCVAFGEIGLDYSSKSPSSCDVQKEVFAHQLKLGVSCNKPFILHCRDAENDLLDILKAHVPREWKIHFHCFTGGLEIAREYLAAFPNSYLGVCGNVTFGDAHKVSAIAQKIPLDKLLVETDAPYHTPRNLPRAGRCKFSHPAHAHYVAKEIANLKGMDLVDVLKKIRENTKTMYGI